MSALVFRGGTGSPYRAPCGGWASPPRIWLPTHWTHYRPSDAAFNAYANTTLVDNPMCGNHYPGMGSTEAACGGAGCPSQVPPFQIPNDCINIACIATPATCDGSFNPPASPPCGTVSTGPDLTVMAGDQSAFAPLANTYELKGGTVSKAVCKKTGWKNVIGQKCWHGHPAYMDADKCANCPDPTSPGPAQPNPNDTRYRTLTWTLTDITYPSVGPMVAESTTSYTGTMTIDRYSGKITGTFDVKIFGPATAGPPPALDVSWPGALWDTFFDSDFCSGAYVGTEATLLNTLGAGTGTTVTLGPNISATSFEVEVTTVASATKDVKYIKLVYSDPYTSNNLNDDVNGLLALWDMSDDAIYPWRTDALCTMGPKVGYWEKVPTKPFVAALGGPPTPAYFSGPAITGTVTGTYTDGNGTGDYSFSYDGSTASSEWSGTLVDAALYDGRILGAPNPYGPGADPWWDSRHASYENFGSGLTPAYYGAYAPCWCPSATQWTNEADGMFLFPGAFAAFGPAMVDPRTGDPLGDVLLKCKWAEVILLSTPSINYARPLGLRDQALRDQTTVDCTCTPPWVNQYGNLLFPSAPAETVSAWNDNRPKGDWGLLTWTNDFRNSPGSPLTTTFTQECSQFMPCCPAVVYITPQDGSQPVGETNGTFNSQSFGTPITNIAVDHCYGNLVQMIPKQLMTDPLWQKPVKPCDLRANCDGDGADDGAAWTEDDGSGLPDNPSSSPPVDYFPQRPWVECRNSDPAGAPTIGFTYNAIVSLLDPGLQAPIQLGTVAQPAQVVWSWMLPWIWIPNRLADVAVSGRFSCEYADPMAVCTDDSEVSDL